MANIPKLKKSARANENVSVANIMGAGEAEARAIETGTKQLQGIVKTVGDITELKITQEATNTARDKEFELQAYISDEDGKLKQQFLKQNKGNVTGYASWKAERVQEKRNLLSEEIGHKQVRSKFNDTTSYNIRKNFSYDVRTENAEIKAIAKDEADKSLALNVMKTQNLTPDSGGDRELLVIEANALKDIDDKVDAGLLSELEAKTQKDEISDTLGYNRIKSQVQQNNFKGAVKNFQRGSFSSPQMQMKVGDMIKREELRRLKDGESELEKAVKHKKLIRDYQTLDFSEKAGAISVSDMDAEEKANALRELEIKYPSADQARIKQFKRIGAAATTASIQNLVNGSRDPDASTKDLANIVGQLTDLQRATTDNEVTQKHLTGIIKAVNTTIGNSNKRIASASNRKFYRMNKGFTRKLEEYEANVQEFNYLPTEQQYEMAALETDRDFASGDTRTTPTNINDDIPSKDINLKRISESFSDPTAKKAMRAEVYKTMEKNWVNPFVFDDTLDAETEKVMAQAERYYNATTKYEENKTRILSNADRQSKYAEE
jgi:hypothetical protein